MSTDSIRYHIQSTNRCRFQYLVIYSQLFRWTLVDGHLHHRGLVVRTNCVGASWSSCELTDWMLQQLLRVAFQVDHPTGNRCFLPFARCDVLKCPMTTNRPYDFNKYTDVSVSSLISSLDGLTKSVLRVRCCISESSTYSGSRRGSSWTLRWVRPTVADRWYCIDCKLTVSYCIWETFSAARCSMTRPTRE